MSSSLLVHPGPLARRTSCIAGAASCIAGAMAMAVQQLPAQGVRFLPGVQTVQNYFPHAGGALMHGWDGNTGTVLWRSDGTPAGTVKVASFSRLPQHFSWIHRVGSKLLFLINNGTGTEVWTTDGTSAGTRKLATQAGARYLRSTFLGFTNDKAFYLGAQGGNLPYALCVTDGTQKGTLKLHDFAQAVGFWQNFGDFTLFSGRDGSRHDLWRSDGTVAGTVRLTGGSAGPVLDANQGARHRGYYFFLAWDPNGGGIYRSDGTTAGTKLHYRSPTGSSLPLFHGAAGDYLFLSFQPSGGGRTQLVGIHHRTGAANTLNFAGANFSGFPAVFQDQLLCRIHVPPALFQPERYELWMTDGKTTRKIGVTEKYLNGRESLVLGSRHALLAYDKVLHLVSTGPPVIHSSPANLLPGIPPHKLSLCDRQVFLTAGTQTMVLDWPAATTRDLGDGLGQGTRVPELHISDPVLGQSVQIEVRNIVANAQVSLGFTPGAPTPIRVMANAYVHAGPGTVVFLNGISTGEQWSARVPLPNVPQLVGMRGTIQALVLGTGANRGFELSNAQRLVLGY